MAVAEKGICLECGGYGSLTPDGFCVMCVIGPDGKIPVVTPRTLSQPEIDDLMGSLRFRLVNGAQKYQGSYLHADLRTDLEEELFDLANYALLMVKRIREVLPLFAGKTSGELVP